MRINSMANLFIATLAVVVFASVGCLEPQEGTGTAPTANKSDDGHDDHDHPAHGPFGGHIFDIDSAEYQGEWKTYRDNNIIRMYLLDGDGKKEVVAKVDSFVIKPQAGKGDVTFELTAEDPDDEGASSTYMIDDEDLSIAIPLGISIEIKIGDKTHIGTIKAHKPMDH